MFIGGSGRCCCSPCIRWPCGRGEHSDYRGDPGAAERTSYFLAVTTFGRAEDARAAIARVRAVH